MKHSYHRTGAVRPCFGEDLVFRLIWYWLPCTLFFQLEPVSDQL